MRIVVLLMSLLLFCGQARAQSLTLKWSDKSDNEQGFRCERQVNGGSWFRVCDVGPNVTTWLDANVVLDTPYCYRISAHNEKGESAYSNTTCRTLTAGKPDVTLDLICKTIPETGDAPIVALSFNEGSGTSANDRSGNGHTGNISGATWTTSGKYGKALFFDGVNDVVVVNDTAMLDVTKALTIEAWVYPTVVPSYWKAIVQKQSDAYLLAAGSSTGAPSMGGTINGACCTHAVAPTRLAVNIWTHITGTYDGVVMRLYINGVQVASRPATGSLQVTTNPLRIGGNTYAGEFFQGRIDEVRIYNKTLTPQQIQTDMTQPIN